MTSRRVSTPTPPARSAHTRATVLRCALAGSIALSPAGHASAHGLALDVVVDGTTLRGSARYSDRSPVAREQVQVHSPADAPEASRTITTAGDGRFAIDGVAGRSYRFVLDAGEGHQVEQTVAIPAQSTQPAQAPPAAGSARALTRADLDAALLPLREDLATLTRQWRMTDLFAAIGYVLGIYGLVAWLRAGRS
ncbi:MAG: hypothetical protein AB7P21_19070 [Lautropia sp.]